MSGGPGPWTAANATRVINACAARADLQISRTVHARSQMADRDLIMSDLLHLLKRGFVYDEPVPASRAGFFRYAVEGTTPNSEGRSVRAIVIPDGVKELKIVTVMWRDEK
jgi:hypothetical protein